MGKLFDKICHVDTLQQAWIHILKKNSKGGLDDVQPADWETGIDKRLETLSRDLKTNAYVPIPYAKGKMPKFNEKNEFRNLSLPSVLDKIVQQAFVITVEPIFERGFKDCSYAYRKGKGAVRAIKHLEFYLETTGVNWVISPDIDDFFDTMNHQLLLNELGKKVHEEQVLNLASLWLHAGAVSSRGDWDDTEEGIAQGSVVSPLFSNIYLHTLDEFALEKQFKYIRYSDNFVVVAKERDRIYIAYEQINAFIENELSLKLNENPQPFRQIKRGFVFLGIFFKNNLRRISSAKENKTFRKLNWYTEKRYRKNVENFVEQLNAAIQGKKRYYGFINPAGQFEAFDQHLVKRLKYLFRHYVETGAIKDRDECRQWLMKIVFFKDMIQSDREALCKGLVKDIFSFPTAKSENKPPQESTQKKSGRIAAKKNKYLKKVADQVEIQISTPGVFLGKTNQRLVVRESRKNVLELPFSKIRNLSINSNGVSLSSDLVFHCSKNKIPITFYTYNGRPSAILQSPVHSSGNLSVLQARACETKKALKLSKKVLKGKTTNQINLLKYYLRSRKSKNGDFAVSVQNTIKQMNETAQTIQTIEFNRTYSITRDRLFGAEARIGACYWSGMKLLVRPELGFENRTRQKADDLVNNMLNYGYGILYQRVWQAVVKQGLNPNISFLHAFQAGKPTLIYDMVEEFRQPFVDRAVFSLLTKGKKGEDLKLDPKTGLLDKETRDRVVAAVLGRLSTLIKFRGKKIKCETVIELQMKNLALFLESNTNYKPFISGY